MAKKPKKKPGKPRKPRSRQRPTKEGKPTDMFGNDIVRLLSLRQYATSRKQTLKAVQKAIATGRITVEEGGKINPELADVQWQANTDTRRQPLDDNFGANANAGGNNSDQLRNARIVRAVYDAKLVELHFKTKSGKLVERTEVYRQQFAASRVLRDRLLTIGDRIAPMILGKSNITEIAEAMNGEVRTALREFVEQMEAMAEIEEEDGDDNTITE